MKQHVLIVEDDKAMQSFLKTLCESSGFRVTLTDHVEAGLRYLSEDPADVCLLDLGLPDGSGHDFIARSKPHCACPIIVISARNTDIDKITALDQGADDYMPKPFSSGELLARIRVALRRNPLPHEEGVLKAQHVRVDLDSRQVYLQDSIAPIHLTPIEYNLFVLLLQHKNKVLTYSYIGREVWGTQFTGSTEKIRVHIAQLRQKVERDAAVPKLIINAPGVGYRLVSDV